MTAEFDWEVLRTTTTTTWHEARDDHSVDVERTIQNWMRIRVALAGRMGQHIIRADRPPGPNDVQAALQTVERGPGLTVAFGSSYGKCSTEQVAAAAYAVSSQDLASGDVVLHVVERRRHVRLVAAGGETVDWRACDRRTVLGLRHAGRSLPVACLDDAHARHCDVFPAVEVVPLRRLSQSSARPWIWSPLALSSLLCRRWANRLAEADPGAPEQWPADLSLLDHGSDAPTDLEGTPRRRTWLVQQGRRTPLSVSLW